MTESKSVVAVGSKEFTIKSAKVKDIRWLNQQLDKADGDFAKFEVMVGFVSRLGVPEDEIDDMTREDFESLCQQISQSKKK